VNILWSISLNRYINYINEIVNIYHYFSMSFAYNIFKWDKCVLWLVTITVEVFQALHDYNLTWGLPVHTIHPSFDDCVDLFQSHCFNITVNSALLKCWNFYSIFVCSSLNVNQLLHLKRIMHNVLCATGCIYLREVIQKFPSFALECESSEHLPFLLLLFN